MSAVLVLANLAVSHPAAAAARSLKVGNVTITEGDKNKAMKFAVSLSGPSKNEVTVDYSTLPDTATVLNDFKARNGTLTFRPGQMSKTISVPIVGDNLDEPAETLRLKLTNPSGASISDATGTGTIKDDDGPPQITLDGLDQRWGIFRVDETAPDITIPVKLSAPSGFTVTVEYETSDDFGTNPGGATEGDDYTSTSGTLEFEPGETLKNVQVPILNDETDEGAEFFAFILMNPVKATVPNNSELPNPTWGTGIIDDECVDGDDEPNDDVSSAIMLSEPRSGVSCPLEDDYYKIGLQKGQVLTVNLTYDGSTEGPLFMALYNQANFGQSPALPALTSTDNAGNDTLQYAAPKAASYYVWVAGATMTTDYTIAANVSTPPACDDDAYEVNDERSSATPLPKGTVLPAGICSGDVDYFKFSTKKYDTVRVRMDSVSVNGNLDLEVVNRAGDIVAMTFGENDREDAEFVAPSASTYYARVFSQGIGVQNPYEISLKKTPIGPCTNDGFEPNNRAGTATSLTSGTTRQAKICPDDVDFWKISANKGKLVKTAVVTGTEAGMVHGLVLGPDGDPVSSIDPLSPFQFIAPKTGTYRFKLQGSPPSGKLPYSIKVTVKSLPPCTNDANEPNDDSSTATPIALAASELAKICKDDVDWWSFPVSDKTTRVELSSVAADGDLDLLVFGPDGLEQIDGIGGPEDIHAIEFMGDPGTYFAVVVPATETDQNAYQLTVTEMENP